MYLLEVIPLTKIPLAQPRILTYFSGVPLPPGALILAPLGKRQEESAVLRCESLEKNKMEIKKAGFELRSVSKIISSEPILTKEQLKLVLWLGQYYFASPGVFLKMTIPKKSQNSKVKTQNCKSKFKSEEIQKLIIAPTISAVKKYTEDDKKIVLWHSDLAPKKKNEIWWQARNGEAETVVGTRSAVFLPFQNLKKIIVEDESNPSHKSWDMWPHWRTHEAARKIAEIFKTELILKSDFPSVESYFHDVGHREFQIIKPREIEIIDLRQEPKEGNFSLFSRRLQELIKEALARKERIILFSLRRGAANFIFCRDCGQAIKCQNCSSFPAYHLINGRPALFCHRCGQKQPPPKICPVCQSWQLKTAAGGAQKAEIEISKIFPGAKIARLDFDSAPKVIQQKKIVESFLKKEIDILVATPILFSWKEELRKNKAEIIALISAETIFNLPDFRAGERIFQIIETLDGLAKNHFLIQTQNPENQILNYALKNQWKDFFEEELSTRQTLNYPPFSQIVKITFRHKDPLKAGQEAKILKLKLAREKKDKNIEISEALPAFISKEKGKYAWNIIIKFIIPNAKIGITGEFLAARNSLLKFIPSNFEIDVDPVDLL